MESFSAENEDEVGFRAGERIHVINKSMDGWWKIRYVRCKLISVQLQMHWLRFLELSFIVLYTVKNEMIACIP